MVLSLDEHLLQVSRLFYSIAIGDGNLHDSESEILTLAIMDYQKLVISKYSRENLNKEVTYIELLTRAAEEVDDSLIFFESFRNYYTMHQEEFTREQKDLILSWSNKIASAYAKKNKSELVLLAKTSLLFNPL